LKHLRTPADLSAFIRRCGPFDLCIWDFDGVVCDSEPWQAESYRTVLIRRGVGTRADFFAGYVGLTEPEIWDRIVAEYGVTADRRDLARERIEVIRQALLRDAPPNWFVRPAHDVLRATATRSIIVSSGNLSLIEAYLAAWSLDHLFDAVSGIGPKAIPKKQRMMELLASARGRVLLFEDVDSYLAVGSAHGAVAVGVSHGMNAGRLSSADAVILASPETQRSTSAWRGRAGFHDGRAIRATIGDVARRAGVSTATVSRILAGVGRARPETMGRVRTAARELGYRPSGIARSLKLRSTRTLGLIVTDIENPYFPELVRAIEDAARSAGYAVLLGNAADDPEREAGYLDLLVERRVDGIIIAASGLGAHHREWLAAAPLPVVLVNTTAEEVGLPAVVSDNRAGGRIAVEHLLELGHTRIGHLTAAPRNVDAPDRLDGARDAFEAAHRPPDELVVASGDPGVAGGEQAMDELLTRDPTLTAVFAYNDLMAIGAMRAIRRSGRHVPGDLSVVGFDDVRLAAYVDPPLTTIAQSTAEMGRWAFERLARELSGPGDGTMPDVLRLPVRIEIRGSTGPPPG
jgi:DNA-binding LacI/PurR family transcriptional regulator/beta-phosphoglucomutase-like phosphatase (HAD superfamily)